MPHGTRRFWGITGAVALTSLGGLWVRGLNHPAALPEYGSLPAFTMTAVTSRGTRKIGLQDLKGTIWLAGFVFTRCGGPCPLVMNAMVRVHEAMPGAVQLVTFTVDPDWDTPEVLRRYAGRFGMDLERWWLLRGSPQALYDVVYEGFKLTVFQQPGAPASFRVLHSTKLALVDPRGRVRAYYESDAEDFLGGIQRDLSVLRREGMG